METDRRTKEREPSGNRSHKGRERHWLFLRGRSSPTNQGPEPAMGRRRLPGDLHIPSEGKPSSKTKHKQGPQPFRASETLDKRRVHVGPLCPEATETDPFPVHRRPGGPRASGPQAHSITPGGPQPTSGPAPEVHASRRQGGHRAPPARSQRAGSLRVPGAARPGPDPLGQQLQGGRDSSPRRIPLFKLRKLRNPFL